MQRKSKRGGISKIHEHAAGCCDYLRELRVGLVKSIIGLVEGNADIDAGAAVDISNRGQGLLLTSFINAVPYCPSSTYTGLRNSVGRVTNVPSTVILLTGGGDGMCGMFRALTEATDSAGYGNTDRS